MNISYEKVRDFAKFVKYLIPSIIGMLFISLYATVDCYFLANYAAVDELAGVNIVLPYMNLAWGIAVMIATGSSALIGIKIGKGKIEKAKTDFSSIFLTLFLSSVVLMVLSLMFSNSILGILGANEKLFPVSQVYLLATIIATPILVTKLFLEYYIRLDGSPRFSMAVSTVGLILNIVIDYITIAVLGKGVWGAGFSTVLSTLISALLAISYFIYFPKVLKFVRPYWNPELLKKSITNGFSELFTEISSGIVIVLFNFVILGYKGEVGVASVAVVLNIYYILLSIYLGIASGAQPLISVNYGKKNKLNLKRVMVYCRNLIALSSVLIFIFAQNFNVSIVNVFAGDKKELFAIALNGFDLFSYCFLFLGVNIYTSSFYTSIGNGKISALISLLRSLVFVIIALIILPKFWGVNGVWWSVPVAEALTMLFSLTAYYLFVERYFMVKKYN
jgi:Na+-driven multidrug efflux pump